MDGPRVGPEDWTEREGVQAVDRAALAARVIWRETPLRDVGIDGQLEHVLPDGVVSGRIVAVQIKSGPSFWERKDATTVKVTPVVKHRAYWARHPLPVILVLHNEKTSETIWADARSQLRVGATSITLPLANKLDAAGVKRALASDGPLPEERRQVDEILREMAERRHPNPGFRVSFLDLFTGGMTDIAHNLYFGMDLAHETQDVLAVLPGGNNMVSIGHDEYSFLDDYVTFLIARDLARVNFDAWKRMNDRFQMTGTWIAPLTKAGEEVVARIAELHPDLVGVTRERSVGMTLRDMDERVQQQLELANRLVGRA